MLNYTNSSIYEHQDSFDKKIQAKLFKKIFLDATEEPIDPERPLSLEARRMIIRAQLRSYHPNAIFPHVPTSIGKTASYLAFVRQHDAVVEGRYTLQGVPSSAYNHITCVYYNADNSEITRSRISAKPGFCDVGHAHVPSVHQLEIQVKGVSRAPTDGYLSLDGTYTPVKEVPNYGKIFGNKDAELCQSLCFDALNTPNDQIKTDSNTGEITWNVVPKRLDSSSSIRLERIIVETSITNIGTITVTPIALQNDGQFVQLNSISGQVNSPITDFQNDNTMDIYLVSVTMHPTNSDSTIDPNQISILVDYCSLLGSERRSPNRNSLNSFFVSNLGLNINKHNPRPCMFSLRIFFLIISMCIIVINVAIIIPSSIQKPNYDQTYNIPPPVRAVQYLSKPINGNSCS